VTSALPYIDRQIPLSASGGAVEYSVRTGAGDYIKLDMGYGAL
jgi:hypothetical protein